MKRTLLLTIFICLFAFAASAQKTGDCGDCADGQYESKPVKEQVQVTKPKKKKISVFPNPAVDFIGLSDADSKSVNKITLLNVMGRAVKTFQVEKGMKYNVASLKRGMYLVQLVDHKNKIITTQRLNKR